MTKGVYRAVIGGYYNPLKAVLFLTINFSRVCHDFFLCLDCREM